MANWIKLTAKRGESIYVNLDSALTVHWNEHDNVSAITFAGATDATTVQEKPEQILKEPIRA
jgi:hypothetical protein